MLLCPAIFAPHARLPPLGLGLHCLHHGSRHEALPPNRSRPHRLHKIDEHLERSVRRARRQRLVRNISSYGEKRWMSSRRSKGPKYLRKKLAPSKGNRCLSRIRHEMSKQPTKICRSKGITKEQGQTHNLKSPQKSKSSMTKS